jgi:histidinol-phosphate aminotransferase
MVVVENPNGFLGICPTMVQLRRVVEKAAAAGAIALVDEAYFHFHDQTAVGWIGEFDNLIISRTFSKAFGLAGMRAGYMISGKENIESLKKVRPAYELTSATAALVCGLIDNYGEVEKYLANTKRNLADLKKELAKHGIASSDSKANFIAARLGEAAVHDELRDRLARKGILIRRPFREDHLKEWVRISTSVPAVQKTILDELGKILKGVKR